MNRGCPNCGETKHVELEVDSWECKLRVSPWYFGTKPFEPCICLNCGTIYIDSATLNKINTKIKEAYNNSSEK